MRDDTLTAAPAAALESPQAYTPRHLAERILSERSTLEGQQKQVTVLFCDLVSSTALAERLGPEGMHALLLRFFELALGEVHRYQGTINQFLGGRGRRGRGVSGGLGMRRGRGVQEVMTGTAGCRTWVGGRITRRRDAAASWRSRSTGGGGATWTT